jgi:hypothetical protein
MTKEIWDKWQSGILPDDDDLKLVIKFLRPLEESLRLLGPHFYLALKEIRTELDRAEKCFDMRKRGD